MLYPAELLSRGSASLGAARLACATSAERRALDYTAIESLRPCAACAASNRLLVDQEPAETDRARDHAVHAERRKTPATFEIPHQEAHAEPRGNAREHAAHERLGARIVRPRRKNEPGRGPHIAPIRQCIESIFWTLKDRLGLERHNARSLHGLRARIAAKLLALAASVWLNHYLGERPTRAIADLSR